MALFVVQRDLSNVPPEDLRQQQRNPKHRTRTDKDAVQALEGAAAGRDDAPGLA